MAITPRLEDLLPKEDVELIRRTARSIMTGVPEGTITAQQANAMKPGMEVPLRLGKLILEFHKYANPTIKKAAKNGNGHKAKSK